MHGLDSTCPHKGNVIIALQGTAYYVLMGHPPMRIMGLFFIWEMLNMPGNRMKNSHTLWGLADFRHWGVQLLMETTFKKGSNWLWVPTFKMNP